MALLADGLLPATFRGVPFAVQSDSAGGGRRQAVHLYPGRDTPWAEDMGRAARTYSFRGFIVDSDVVFLGGPIQLQRALLIAALEASGSGLLTHPTLGILQVSVTRFSMGQDLGAGRMSSVDIDFVESGKKSFPSILSLSSGLLSAAAVTVIAVATDLARVAIGASSEVGATENAGATGSAYAAKVVTSGQDATALQRLTAQMSGPYGRYASGANTGFAASTSSPYSADTTIEQFVAAASAQRVAIAGAATSVAAASATLSNAASVATLSAAIAILIDCLLAACADPSDAVRLLIGLISNPPALAASSSSIGSGIILAFQRTAAAALAKACAQYQPSSYTDAADLLSLVAALIDRVATAAADAGDDASFDALESLLVSVVTDLTSRGAELAPVRTFSFPTSLPDVVLAQRLYRDPSRADELVQEANPIHPLFMPSSFQALAS